MVFKCFWNLWFSLFLSWGSVICCNLASISPFLSILRQIFHLSRYVCLWRPSADCSRQHLGRGVIVWSVSDRGWPIWRLLWCCRGLTHNREVLLLWYHYRWVRWFVFRKPKISWGELIFRRESSSFDILWRFIVSPRRVCRHMMRTLGCEWGNEQRGIALPGIAGIIAQAI